MALLVREMQSILELRWQSTVTDFEMKHCETVEGVSHCCCSRLFEGLGDDDDEDDDDEVENMLYF